MAEALTCPWCGEPVRHTGWIPPNAGSESPHWYVLCENKKCPVMPQMMRDYADDGAYKRAWRKLKT